MSSYYPMHASFHFINQIIQLAYTTQACISNLKHMQCKQAHEYAHLKMQSLKVHELAPPTCVLLLSKNFDPSLFFNVAPSLSMSNLYFFYISSLHVQFLPHSIKLSYLCTISPPLSSISIKGMLLIDAKVYSLG